MSSLHRGIFRNDCYPNYYMKLEILKVFIEEFKRHVLLPSKVPKMMIISVTLSMQHHGAPTKLLIGLKMLNSYIFRCL